MTAQPQLKVTSHVGRDLLASASSFKSEAPVVWEYVVNSLQYVDPGVSPRVQVTIAPGRKGIVISDNGCGMSSNDLTHFFRMHGENLERKAGRTGRGKFGTGKSAAFGIANVLRVDTIRNGKRDVVSLTRQMIEKSGGGEISLQWEVKDEVVDEPNGTTVSILDINLDRVKRASIIEYIERHLQAFRAAAPAVAIDDHVCSYREPATAETLKFEPTGVQRASLVRRSKEARKTEQARRLAMEADKIAQILNDDFRKISDRLHEIRAASSRKGAAQAQFGAQATDEGTDDWVRGTK